jgi:hypothetical protein
MSTDDLGQELHDKATRGGVLSADEQTLLDKWYALHDQQESAALAGTGPTDALAALQAQVTAAVAQLSTVSQRIQVLSGENDALRQEVAALQRQLALRTTAQTA